MHSPTCPHKFGDVLVVEALGNLNDQLWDREEASRRGLHGYCYGSREQRRVLLLYTRGERRWLSGQSLITLLCKWRRFDGPVLGI